MRLGPGVYVFGKRSVDSKAPTRTRPLNNRDHVGATTDQRTGDATTAEPMPARASTSNTLQRRQAQAAGRHRSDVTSSCSRPVPLFIAAARLGRPTSDEFDGDRSEPAERTDCGTLAVPGVAADTSATGAVLASRPGPREAGWNPVLSVLLPSDFTGEVGANLTADGPGLRRTSAGVGEALWEQSERAGMQWHGRGQGLETP